MNEIRDGGPAFPRDPFIASDPGHEDVAKRLAEGMTLPDYFAAKADMSAYRPVVALENRDGRLPTMLEVAEHIAQLRWMEADALLRSRAGS